MWSVTSAGEQGEALGGPEWVQIRILEVNDSVVFHVAVVMPLIVPYHSLTVFC